LPVRHLVHLVPFSWAMFTVLVMATYTAVRVPLETNRLCSLCCRPLPCNPHPAGVYTPCAHALPACCLVCVRCCISAELDCIPDGVASGCVHQHFGGAQGSEQALCCTSCQLPGGILQVRYCACSLHSCRRTDIGAAHRGGDCGPGDTSMPLGVWAGGEQGSRCAHFYHSSPSRMLPTPPALPGPPMTRS
jgi:hypothetical protein